MFKGKVLVEKVDLWAMSGWYILVYALSLLQFFPEPGLVYFKKVLFLSVFGLLITRKIILKGESNVQMVKKSRKRSRR